MATKQQLFSLAPETFDRVAQASDTKEVFFIKAGNAGSSAKNLSNGDANNFRIYNETNDTYYILRLQGTAGNEFLAWTPEP